MIIQMAIFVGHLIGSEKSSVSVIRYLRFAIIMTGSNVSAIYHHLKLLISLRTVALSTTILNHEHLKTMHHMVDILYANTGVSAVIDLRLAVYLVPIIPIKQIDKSRK